MMLTRRIRFSYPCFSAFICGSIFFLLAACGLSAQQMPSIEPGVSLELAKWRAERYSDVRYKLNLTLEKMSPVLKGTMEIRVKVQDGSPPYEGGVGAALGGRGGSPIVLDWRKIRGSENLSTISNVLINGRVAENHPVAEAATPLLRKEGSFAYSEQNEHLIFRDGVVIGENVIKLDFTSPILTSGSAITRYVDKEDGAEYIYSLFVPSDASTAFPVFDQPDLKARFKLNISRPPDWKIAANALPAGGLTMSSGGADPAIEWFEETKPISTYVFAFAAGPFERVSEPGTIVTGALSGANKTAGESSKAPIAIAPGSDKTGPGDRVSAPPAVAGGSLAPWNKSDGQSLKAPPATAGGTDSSAAPTSIYVRKSQAAKFKPHAAEVFRLNREAIKYFESYFDYKFPFPKYDVVLIPEFPFGGMEHAGATFLRESSIIFPQQPTKNDYISRATLIFHEAAHQWFGDTVTMRWFDDLWLKEGFATFTAYKAMEKIMPEYNAWKVFYERVKQAAYQTDSTKGTTPIYQKIDNLSAAKSAYGNIVYRKAPSFLRQAEFYLGQDKFQTAVRAFLKKHEYANAGWEDLVTEFEENHSRELKEWAEVWVTERGLPKFKITKKVGKTLSIIEQFAIIGVENRWEQKFKALAVFADGSRVERTIDFTNATHWKWIGFPNWRAVVTKFEPIAIIPNYQDYGYGIFLLDDKSRDYVLKNIQNEKDPFLRSMMWGSLWDSVREAELDPKVYVELVIQNLGSSELRLQPRKTITPKGVTLNSETDETIIQSLLGRVGTAMNYYLPDAQRNAIAPRLESVLLDRLQHAPTAGQRITFYRAFVMNASTAKGREVLKEMLAQGSPGGQRSPNAVSAGSRHSDVPLRTKDRFDIVTRLIILGDPDAPKLLAQLEKTETGDDAKRYAYAARAGIATAENKAKYWSDFTINKDISESWIEAAFGPFNSVRHSDLTLPYLERALAELPNHKRTRKIFFVNGWLGAFIGGRKSEAALAIVNKFLADNPNLDRDLRLKILENVDLIERAVKIRSKYSK